MYLGANSDLGQVPTSSAGIESATGTPLSMSPNLIMNTINYTDIPGSDDSDSICMPTGLESVTGLGSNSPPVGVLNAVPYIPGLQLDNSPQSTVSPADPNLNMGPLGSPLGCHVITSNCNGSPLQAGEPFNLSTVNKCLKQEVI